MKQEEKNKKDKKKAIIATSATHALLLIAFIIFGLPYEEPRPQKGYIVNFGTSELGFGEREEEPQSATAASTQQPVNQERVETSETNNQQVQTQDATDAPSIENQASKQINSNTPTDPQKVKDPKPSDGLSKLLQNVKNSKEGGDGNDNKPGNKGDDNGDVNSNNYDGDNSSGGGKGNYRLGNRKALDKTKPTYEPCTDEGRVVVKISVNRQGKVIRAVPGEKTPDGIGSTTTSRCLFGKAKSAALKTTWQADQDAGDIQVGYIIYNFYKS